MFLDVSFAFHLDVSASPSPSPRPRRASLWKLVLLLGVVGAVSSGCTGGREARTARPAADSTLPPAALKQDLDVLRRTIQKVHPAFADSTARTGSFRQAVDSLQADLDQPMTPCAFHRRVAPLVTALDDGHTNLGFGHCFGSFAKTKRMFPFDIALTDSTAMVLRSYHDEAPVAPGTRIVAVDGTPVSTLHDQFLQRVPGARSAYRRQKFEGQTDTFKFFLWHVSGMEAPFDLTVRDDEGERSVAVDGVPADTTFDQIRRTGTEHLLIDVRDNSGGQSGRAEALLRYLASSPFALTDTVAARASETFKIQMKRRIPAAVRWLPLQYLDERGRAVWGVPEGRIVEMPSEHVSPHDADERFDGRVSALVNEGTFSAATLFAAAVKKLGIGALVGRKTGGPAGIMFAENVPTQLPNSRLWLQVSAMRFQFGDKLPDWPARGVRPDHRVPRDLPARAGGADPILERAKVIDDS